MLAFQKRFAAVLTTALIPVVERAERCIGAAELTGSAPWATAVGEGLYCGDLWSMGWGIVDGLETG